MKTKQSKKREIMKIRNMAIFATAVAAGLLSCNNNANQGDSKKTVELSGAGATFPLPYYNLAFETFKQETGNTVSYGGIGSGGGIRSLKDEIVDFAGTDAFLSNEEMAEMKPVIHIPTCMGAVVLAYNLEGINDLNLTGEIVADIFAGKITHWSDTKIKEINPTTKLPNKKITPIYRSDGSGTTFVFTDYLSKVSENWKNKYGTGKSVNFPVGIAAKGNPGVSGNITQTAGSIGYVGSEYAFAQKIPYATLQNAQGEFIKPNSQSISAAAQGEIPDDTRTMITNSDAQGAYPISCFTWIIAYQNQNYANRSKNQADATIELLKFMLGNNAQSLTEKVHYAPLPKAAIEKGLKAIETIQYK